MDFFKDQSVDKKFCLVQKLVTHEQPLAEHQLK